jgi:hypothetical protein
MKLVVLYCHFRKFFDDSSFETEALKTKLATSEAEISKLRETDVD